MIVQLQDILLFGFCVIFSALSLAAAHWLPWHRGARVLDRLSAYTIGTLVVAGVPMATMLLANVLALHRGELFWFGLLFINTLACGATVRLCYWIDGSRIITMDEVLHAAATRGE